MSIEKKEEIIAHNEVVFRSLTQGLYVKEVDIYSDVVSYTKDVDEALAMPNTINFKNSRKYKKLIMNLDLEPLNKIQKVIYETHLEGL
ncbi:hypothetical protein phi_676Z_ORF038 [Staphylococcus phage 676Z]|uniref:Uncharacterized protein n=1 Tax=Staphylococcus phage 676Z TaxID=1195081 RepID=I6WJV0_9CAUD|nr:hypothetical protein QLX31_gp056 [Staphylococcus phage 676Z]AFN38278.1 hypothetical protein phi_676Z_ORF038 [Staphylococcus phage 676Z]